MTIQAVCFDLDDTLLWDERSIEEAFHFTCLTAAEKTGIHALELEASVRAEARKLYESYETFAFTKLIGINPFEALWAHFSAGTQAEFRALEKLAPTYRLDAWTRGLQALGVNDNQLAAQLAEQFGAERRSRPYVYEETFQILNELKGHVKLLLLTNGCPALQQEKLDGVPDLVPYFDEVIISGSFGKGKPDRTIFEHALRLLEVQPQNVLMVGDKLTTDIKGSNSVGIHSVWINRDGKSRTNEIVPEFEIKHLSELHSILQQAGGLKV
ncbi:putative hydrolase of the HAD superfamily [Paenibacillus shirakamiensis]|uniref:Phosphoserine phosphatase n=1 Tax=Paenibacillus shirakamiensis TaxID=1265935 RepID=A0ABS4JDN5_9BACL|nr:HAD family hydrolase [Paenibacillus shirakamiensis]MBP1999785.1 putative hydrolase of the HAD superfamily [Paenibacillus shirakamiensis]